MPFQENTVLIISESSNRISIFSQRLKESARKIITATFNKSLIDFVANEIYDLVILDCYSAVGCDIQKLSKISAMGKLRGVSALFILDERQESLKREFCVDPLNRILIDPVDKFVFLSAVNGAIENAKIQKRLFLYKDVIEGEKKIIANLNHLLDLDSVYQLQDDQKIIEHLQRDTVEKFELALAVEAAVFCEYEPENDLIKIQLKNKYSGKIRKRSIPLKNSKLSDIILNNSPTILETDSLNDLIILELEELFGYKIFGMLVVSLTALHQTRGALILVNKIYRNEFSENDLAFAVIAMQKIGFHLENIYLSYHKNTDHSNWTANFGQNNRILREWKMYRHIMNSVYFGAIVFDGAYKVSFINKAAKQMLHFQSGMTKDEKNLRGIFSEKEFEKIKASIRNNKLPIIRQELNIQAQNISDYYIGYSIYPFEIKEKEQNERFIFIFSEISQTKRIQTEVVRMDRMASLGSLSAGLAHEIRNPLAGIKAMAQSLEEELESNPATTEYVKRILRQVDRLDKLLKAFFSYAKPARPEPNITDIEQIIQEALPLFERKMRDEGVVIKQMYAKDLYRVFVDPNQIEQVILNLMLNAFDAIPGNGTIMIKAENADLSEQPNGDGRASQPTTLLSNKFIKITIEDSGRGIPAEIKENIFNPFFTTKSFGTGLGLSIVYQLIREHGGKIDVQSKVGKGTKFTIHLPAVSNVKKSLPEV
jgi:signal transduction histidine kinase